MSYLRLPRGYKPVRVLTHDDPRRSPFGSEAWPRAAAVRPPIGRRAGSSAAPVRRLGARACVRHVYPCVMVRAFAQYSTSDTAPYRRRRRSPVCAAVRARSHACGLPARARTAALRLGGPRCCPRQQCGDYTKRRPLSADEGMTGARTRRARAARASCRPRRAAAPSR